MKARTIVAVTSTRADYGLLRPVLQKLAVHPALRLRLVVTGAHLCPWLGETVREIEADAAIAACIDARLAVFVPQPEPVGRTIARTIEVFDGYFEQLAAAEKPDAVLLLGDRFEIFAAATAAAARHVPIAHISGGDVTLGAADEYYRHCITKMAALHLPSCADSAARLLRMGEAPETVFNVGGLGDENLRTMPKLSRAQLAADTGLPFERPFGLVTYHPETAADAGDPARQTAALITALQAVPQVFWVLTGSNADAGGDVCTAALQAFAQAQPDRAAFVHSLGAVRYLSALQYAAVVVGNSSSGVVETPTFGVPAVNIGNRQAGRILCENVLWCGATAPAIERCIRAALKPEFAARAKTVQSPYNGGDTSGRIVELLATFDFGRPKKFYDGKGEEP